MKWTLYSLDKKPVNYLEISKNPLIVEGIKKELHIGQNLKINNKIYNIGIVDIENNIAGGNEIKFIDEDEVKENIENEFICPYCNYVYVDAFELEDEGEVECPNCNSKLGYERQVTVEYAVTPIKIGEIIDID